MSAQHFQVCISGIFNWEEAPACTRQAGEITSHGWTGNTSSTEKLEMATKKDWTSAQAAAPLMTSTSCIDFLAFAFYYLFSV